MSTLDELYNKKVLGKKGKVSTLDELYAQKVEGKSGKKSAAKTAPKPGLLAKATKAVSNVLFANAERGSAEFGNQEAYKKFSPAGGKKTTQVFAGTTIGPAKGPMPDKPKKSTFWERTKADLKTLAVGTGDLAKAASIALYTPEGINRPITKDGRSAADILSYENLVKTPAEFVNYLMYHPAEAASNYPASSALTVYGVAKGVQSTKPAAPQVSGLPAVIERPPVKAGARGTVLEGSAPVRAIAGKPGQKALPASQAAPVEPNILSESGKVSKKALVAAGGIAAGGIVSGIGLGKLRSGEKQEPERTEGEYFGQGGMLSRVADVASIGDYLSYAIRRELALPGKQGILKSVKERRSDIDTLGLAGLIPSITLDPFTYVPFAGVISAGKKISKATGASVKLLPVAEKINQTKRILGEVGVIKSAVEKLEFGRYFGGWTIRPETRAAREVLDSETTQMIIQASKLKTRAAKIAKAANDAGPQADKDIARYIEAGLGPGGRPIGDAGTVLAAKKQVFGEIMRESGIEHARKVKGLAEEWSKFDKEIGNTLVASEMLARKTADQWTQVHLRRIYGRFEDAEAYIEALQDTDPVLAQKLMSELQMLKSVAKKPDGALRFGAIMQRADVSPELRALLKEVPEASARMAAGAEKAADLTARADMYKRLAEKIALDEAALQKLGASKIKGYLQIPADIDNIATREKFGALAGKWVPEAIFYDLMHSYAIEPTTLKAIRRGISLWKFGKVPLSLPSQLRNTIANFWLADVLGDTAPYRIDRYAQAMQSLIKKDKWYQEAVENGTFLHDTFISTELRGLIESATKQAKDSPGWIRSALDVMWGGTKKGAAGISKVYEFNEKWFKMAVYINTRSKGILPEMAAEFADRALFNYRKVPRAVDTMRKYGIFPFMVFPYKAIPALAKSFWSNTGRFARYPKAMRAYEAQTPEETRERERAVMPEWMKDTHLRIPGKESRYLDVGYIIPYQDVEDVGKFGNPVEIGKQALGRSMLGAPVELATNRSLLTGAPIVPEGLEEFDLNPNAARNLRLQHAYKWLAPAMAPGAPAFEGMFGKRTKPNVLSPEGEPRTVKERVQYAGGLKTRTLNKQVSYKVFEIKRLQTAARKELSRISQDKQYEQMTAKQQAEYDATIDRYETEIDRLTSEIGKANGQ